MQFRRADIHAHVNFDAFDADREAVLARALSAGTAVINVGTDLASSRRAIELAESHPEGVYAIVGLHPTDTAEKFEPAIWRELAMHPKVVGIGECGLDYFRLEGGGGSGGTGTAAGQAAIAAQKEAFRAQIALAQACDKPLMLHVREAYGDALDIIIAAQASGQAKAPRIRGNAHFFAGTTAEAKRFLDLGFTVSFTGVITFAAQYAELIRYVPLGMMQAETDCPFVAPVPHRGERNEPAHVALVIEAIARIKGLPLAEVEHALYENAQRVWGI